jgi:hypothetical protein
MASIETYYTNRKIVKNWQGFHSTYKREQIKDSYESGKLLKIKLSNSDEPLEEIFVEIVRFTENQNTESNCIIVEGICKKYNGTTYEMEGRGRNISDYYPGYLDFKVFLYFGKSDFTFLSRSGISRKIISIKRFFYNTFGLDLF